MIFCNREMAVPAGLCQFGGPMSVYCVLERGHEGICWAGTKEDHQKYLNKEYPWGPKGDPLSEFMWSVVVDPELGEHHYRGVSFCVVYRDVAGIYHYFNRQEAAVFTARPTDGWNFLAHITRNMTKKMLDSIMGL